MHTLIYHAGALGDFLSILPMVTAWKKLHFRTRVTFLGNLSHGKFRLHFGLFDRIWDLDSAMWAPLFGESPPKNLTAGDSFTDAIVFAADDSPVLSNLRKLGIDRILHHPPFPSQQIPVAEYHLSLISDAGISFKEVPFSLPMKNSRRDPRRFVIHPGSGSPMKNWPIDRFIACAEKVHAQGFLPTWVLGPLERELKDRIPCGQVFTPSDVIECAEDLSRCQVFLGNDSGVMHLAAAAGCFVIGLFGPSDPLVWGPNTPYRFILRNKLPCMPCHQGKRANQSCRNECMMHIEIDDVIAACFEAFSKSMPRK